MRYVPLGEQGEGRVSEVGRTIWQGLIDAFPDLHVSLEYEFEGEADVAAEVIIGGTQQKDFLNIPNQGRRYEVPHAFLLAFDDADRIEQITAYWDNASFYQQWGKATLP